MSRSVEGRLQAVALGSLERKSTCCSLLRVELRGEISGKFHGANAPGVRTDGSGLTNFQGVIETDNGATVLLECHGFGRAYREPYKSQSHCIRQWVATVTHLSQDSRFSWLNYAICVGTGLVQQKTLGYSDSNLADLLLDVAKLIWEPLLE